MIWLHKVESCAEQYRTVCDIIKIQGFPLIRPGGLVFDPMWYTEKPSQKALRCAENDYIKIKKYILVYSINLKCIRHQQQNWKAWNNQQLKSSIKSAHKCININQQKKNTSQNYLLCLPLTAYSSQMGKTIITSCPVFTTSN